MNKPRALVCGMLLCSLAPGGLLEREALAQTGPSSSGRSAVSARDRDWSSILAKEDAGRALLNQEVGAKGNQQNTIKLKREQAFNAAYSLLLKYRSNYLASNAKDVNYLKATYRLAMDAELSGQFAAAQRLYKECQDHPAINSPQAEWNGAKLPSLVSERLSALSKANGRNNQTIKVNVNG